MRNRTVYLRTAATPVWQFVVAAAVAIALGAGTFVLARRPATHFASVALLSFDPVVAGRNDPVIIHKSEPAVAVAQSMLTDTVVLELLRTPGLSSADSANGIGDFRARLELREPSPGSLRVLYHDPDSKRSRTMTNAVARTIAAWMPSASVEPMPVAAAANSLASARSAAYDRLAGQRRQALNSLALSIHTLKAKLDLTDRKLDSFSRQAQVVSPPRTARPSGPTTTQMEERLNLEAQLAAAQKKLDDLRVRYTDEYPDVEMTKDTIAELQQQLAVLPAPSTPSSVEAKPAEPSRRDTEIALLRAERVGLMAQITAEEARLAHLRKEPIPSVPANGTASVPPDISASPVSSSALPAASGATHAWQNPFRIVRLASPTPGGFGWPAMLAASLSVLFIGFITVCLLYWQDRMWRLDASGPAIQQEFTFSAAGEGGETKSVDQSFLAAPDFESGAAANNALAADSTEGVVQEREALAGKSAEMDSPGSEHPNLEAAGRAENSLTGLPYAHPAPAQAHEPPLSPLEDLALLRESEPAQASDVLFSVASEAQVDVGWHDQVKQTLSRTWFGQLYGESDGSQGFPNATHPKDIAASSAGNSQTDERKRQNFGRRALQSREIGAPDWEEHTEKARRAIAEDDLMTAYEEMKIAISMAPEKSKEELNNILRHLRRLA